MNLLIFKWSAEYKTVRFADSHGGIRLRGNRLFPDKETAEARGLSGRKDGITVTMVVKSVYSAEIFSGDTEWLLSRDREKTGLILADMIFEKVRS